MDLIPYFFYCAHIIVLLLLLDCDFSGTVSNGFNDTRLQLGLLLSLLLLLLLLLGEYIHAARTRLGLFDDSRATFHVQTRPLRRPSGSCCYYICTPFFFAVHPSTPLPAQGEKEEEEEETDDVVAVVVIVESVVNFSILYRPLLLLLLLYSSCLVEEEGDG